MTRRSARVFEWLLIATLIGIVLVFAVGLYGRMAGDVQRLSFQLAAQNFGALRCASPVVHSAHPGALRG